MNSKKTNESGRSMVEMLGVLAVMGVLSVTAISGFSLAIDKYRSTQILAAASSMYMAATAHKAIPYAGASYGNIQDEYPYQGVTTSLEEDEDGKIVIKVKDATYKVCKLVHSSFSSDDFTIDCPEGPDPE